MILKKEEWRAMAVCVGLGLYLSLMPHSVLGQDDLTVLLEVSPAQLSKGTPAMLRIVLRNRGPNTTHVSGRLGWGNGIEVLHANPDGAFRPLAPDVPHGDTDLGPIFTPPHNFEGDISVGGFDSILYFVPTDSFSAGTNHLKAKIGCGRNLFESSEIPLVVVQEQETNTVFTVSEMREVVRLVRQLHNYFDHAERKDGAAGDYFMSGLPYVRKALDSEDSTPSVQYALYLGALLSLRQNVNDDVMRMLSHSQEHISERYKGTWLDDETRKASDACQRKIKTSQ